MTPTKLRQRLRLLRLMILDCKKRMSFPPEQVYCVLDYETYSKADLRKVGAFEYSVHPSTEILCAAWRIGTRETLRTAETMYWCSALPNPGSLGSLFKSFMAHDIVLVAHNALFEQVITRNVFAVKYMYSKKAELQSITPMRWLCTASLASALALPRNLEGAGKVLNLQIQKDMEGNRLMKKWMKPRKPTKKDPSTRHTDLAELEKIVKYCITDIDAEVELFLKCPPLTKTERKIWVLDQKINLRGFRVDRELVKTALEFIDVESDRLNKETERETLGLLTSTNQRDATLEYLRSEGVLLPNLQKKTVEDAVSTGLVTGSAKKILEYRLAASKTSNAKYKAFELRSRHDGRLRDILVYHTASTGRWGGAGVQPQNFPRGTLKDSIQASEIVKTGDLELVRMLYGEPMEVLSSCLRNCIVATPGKVLDVADYSAIEARVLFWVAEHAAGIKAFWEGRKLYEELAAVIYNILLPQVNPDQRFLGKQATLGCGYGMGPDKFMATCEALGFPIPKELAIRAVTAYRETHEPVVRLWDKYNYAAIAAVENPGRKFSTNKVIWYYKTGFLWCVLPSGRRLAYFKPSVEWIDTPWGEKRKGLFHYGINSLSKKWEKQKTYGGKLVENVVQAISRDIMAEAMLRIEDTGIWQIVLSVHDELLGERDTNKGSLEQFCELMSELPPWAEGCPIKVEGWSGERYKK